MEAGILQLMFSEMRHDVQCHSQLLSKPSWCAPLVAVLCLEVRNEIQRAENSAVHVPSWLRCACSLEIKA